MDPTVSIMFKSSLSLNPDSTSLFSWLGEFNDLCFSFLICKMEVNSISFSGQGQLHRYSANDTAHALELRIWPCACCWMLHGHHLDIFSRFYFGFMYVMMSDGAVSLALGACSLALCMVLSAPVSPLLWRGSGMPLLLPSLPPQASSGDWPWALEMSGQLTGHLLSVRDRRWSKRLWRCAFTLQASPDRLREKDHGRKEKSFYPSILMRDPAFLFCIEPWKLCNLPWIGCF